MQIIECEQGADAWFAARLGKVTASNFAAVMAKGEGKTRKTYMLRLATEILTGFPEPTFQSQYMENGHETEAEARDAYASTYDCEVVQVGFVLHDDNAGASPDGMVGKDGLVELKCPKSTTHVETILRGSMQACYKPQVQGQLWVTGRKWCDWVSFDPRVSSQPLFCVRQERDDKYIATIEQEVERFITDLHEMVQKVTKCPY